MVLGTKFRARRKHLSFDCGFLCSLFLSRRFWWHQNSCYGWLWSGKRAHFSVCGYYSLSLRQEKLERTQQTITSWIVDRFSHLQSVSTLTDRIASNSPEIIAPRLRTAELWTAKTHATRQQMLVQQILAHSETLLNEHFKVRTCTLEWAENSRLAIQVQLAIVPLPWRSAFAQ